MKVTPIKTRIITEKDTSLFPILDKYITHMEENSVLAIASNIVGICEGRVIKITPDIDKDALIKQEVDYYLPRESNKYAVMITINNNMLLANGGLDESNGNGHYVLWPKDLQKSVNDIREYLLKRFHLQHVGVVMTDSRLSPLRWGVTGFAIAHSGFKPLNNYIGKPDIFGRILQMEQSNVSDTLATAAVAVMGEGNEQQPLAIIEDIPFVQFQKRNPTKKELDSLKISIEDDIYSSLLENVKWQKGGKTNESK